MKRLRGKIKWYHLLLAGLFILVVIIEVNRPVIVDWSAGYGKKETKPYGGYVFFNEFQKLYSDYNIETSTISPYNTLESFPDKVCLYITAEFSPNEMDAKTILDYVNEGGKVFISASYFSGILADTLKLDTQVPWAVNFNHNPFREKTIPHTLHFTDSSFHKEKIKIETGSYIPSFGSYDTTNTVVHTFINDTNAIFISTQFGEGKFYIHSAPELFSNFQLLYGNPDPAFITIAHFLPSSNIIWDEYYKPGRRYHSNIFSFIKSQPELKFGYWTLLFIVFTILLTSFNRRLPAIPIYKKPENTSLEFARTVGTLYFQQGNHTDLAKKMVRYFFEQIRTRFNTNTSMVDNELVLKISERGGLNKDYVKSLFSYLTGMQKSYNVSQNDLIELEKRIRDFNQKSLR